MTFEISLIGLGLFIAFGTMGCILWSVRHPDFRLWPPQSYTKLTPILVWSPTFTLFGIILYLGISDWGSTAVHPWIRFGVGPFTILVGNLLVWSQVLRFGVSQTGGARGVLITEGVYQFSRNPQYLGDSVMLMGWLLLSASFLALPVILAAILVLLIAPLAEEPWLEEFYGQEYQAYKSQVSRFLDVQKLFGSLN